MPKPTDLKYPLAGLSFSEQAITDSMVQQITDLIKNGEVKLVDYLEIMKPKRVLIGAVPGMEGKQKELGALIKERLGIDPLYCFLEKPTNEGDGDKVLFRGSYCIKLSEAGLTTRDLISCDLALGLGDAGNIITVRTPPQLLTGIRLVI
ncbi:hypothetical protein F9Z84_06145 [Escherichia coli]|nr:hypothetical protein F9Z84_06145 [Escherichia coli]